MVSLWPFKGEDNSPAGFEKTLSTLSAKITQSTTRLDLHRQHARRFKALWTLYTTFIYLLYSIILALVLGWENWGVKEYAAILGGPVIIYVVRAGGTMYFEYRINNTQRYLDSLQKQRDETIEKLKVATKYNSTQQLLEKYAGDSPKPGRSKGGDQKSRPENKRKPSGQQQQRPPQPQVQRTGIPPPPTANIRRPAPPPPEQPPSPYPPQQSQQPPRNPPPSGLNEPGFAPNAFPTQQYIEHSRWYDRLLDVLLGEDETQPKNRIVLICAACRLVNGQAPPGMKSLEELGRWRCGGCGAWNGEESAARKVLADIKAESGPASEPSDDEPDIEHRLSASTSDGASDGVIVTKEEDDQGQGRDVEVESRSSSGSAAETPAEDDKPAATVRTRSQRATQRRGRKG
ncbi:uncharacterized protein DSM5745_03568 [Aspergillus mulundensis]|uniref:Endoplasmic reticulum junction formation protein lunapark n=1 Tax=Aspergillus mulundensis TaxID=1810919 RepID=A0A3D8SKX3_9EURO|nr:Uncharacterized protein DSM5745_03568 [Aspergillus mulundensis]RDW86926.1 Uncharacterized protein DSM5745_03568 [Aspergillus mulundensis]